MKERKKKKRKNIIQHTIVYIILSISIWICIDEYKDRRIKQKEAKDSKYITEDLSIQNENIGEDTNNTEKIYPKEEVILEYKGYEVSAKLEIPKINLETYILQSYSVQALKTCVTKFWGPNANEIGNFCIAGHNYRNKKMFQNLKELEIEDRFFISDNKIGKVEYEIYDIYTVIPNDVSCLSQDTNNKREVTLITCTSDSKKRIIVKAKEVEN